MKRLRLVSRILTATFVLGSVVIAPSTPAALDSATQAPVGDVQVARVTPEGKDVPATRQVVVTFDRPMAPIGDMLLTADKSPASITPAVNCHWRWLDPRSLACELDSAGTLLPATEYTISVKVGIKAEDGTTLKEPFSATFSTLKPAVAQYSFKTWRGPGTPVVRLVFNQPVTRNSVESHLRFSGQQSVVAEPEPYDTDVIYVLPLPGEKETLIAQAGAPPAPVPDEEKMEARRLWLVSPPAELPLDAHARLTVVPGLRGYTGTLRGSERRTIVEFDTFPEFRFLGVRCRAPARATLVTPGAARAQQTKCNPLARVSLVFSAPVIATEIKEHLELTPNLAGDRTDYDPWANIYPYSSLMSPHKRGKEYEVQLPEHLQAFKSYSVKGLEGVRDEFGRALRGPTGLQFATDHRSPRLRLAHPVAVLEKDAPTSMPLYVTNLTDVDIRYDRLTASGTERGLIANQKIQRVWDIAYAVPLMTRDLLGGRSGVIAGQLTPRPTSPVLDDGSYFEDGADEVSNDASISRQFLVQVTPFEVHAKLGHYNTLVWVTKLSDGLPVANAKIRIYEDTESGLTAAPQVLGEATTDASGIAMLPGREKLDPDATKMGYGGTSAKHLIVRVDAGGDLALLPLDYDFSIDTYRASRGRFWSSPMRRDGHVRAWGTTAQGVYKLGDTVQYKLYVRNQNNLSLEPVSLRSGYKLTIVDPTGKTVHEVSDVTLSEFGAYAGEFRVPPSGAVGSYEFRLSANKQSWTPMHVLVADFTPAPFQVQNTLNGALYSPGDAVEVSTHATLHAGGPYANAQTRVTARTFPQAIQFATPTASGFYFDSSPIIESCGRRAREETMVVHQSETMVNERGELATSFKLTDARIYYGRLEVESAVRDERGKYVATRASAPYRGLDRYIGLHNDRWSLEEDKPASVEYLVLDKNGKVEAVVPVSISIQGQVTTAARVKGAGNAFLTQYKSEWVSRGSCSGTSGDAAQQCTFTPSEPGLYSIRATVGDAQGREHTTELCTWVTGKGRVMWNEPEDMSLSIVPEKETYQVGERARYLVRNPFPGARALVTIERFGVIRSWVQTLEGNTPIVEVPIEPDYLPGFYLSVVVMSPRVAPAPGIEPIDENGVDLGRPTYRMGYLQTRVTDPYKSFDVGIRSDRTTYKPGENVTLQLEASPHKGKRTREPVELAVAVLDEAVFDLIQDGQSYFDPYRGFYRLDSLDLTNFGLLNRLVGLQKFEKKGANAGGDGGAGFDMRVVKNYVAYWNPSVKADRRGRARVQFKLPDNLTGWRVFALAVTPGDRLGLGDYKFQSSKPTELRPVMPNQLTQGDRFTAGFSVLNRADKARDLTVTLQATGAIMGDKQSTKQTVHLEPFQRDTVWMPLETRGEGAIRLTATASDSLDRDGLEYTVPVHRRVSLDTAASYGTTLSDAATEAVLFPSNMLPDTGALSVIVSPTVIGNLDGAIRYMRDYKYDCWEQRLTRALMAADYVHLREYFPEDMQWPEAQSLPQKVLDDAASYQAPNGGIGFWVPQNDRVNPYLSAATALAFNKLSKAGYRVPKDVESRLHAYLDRFLRDQAAPTFFSEGMVSTVRAVALEALAAHQKVSLADLERYREHVPRMDLFGMAAYLRATLQVKGGEQLGAETARRILSHANQSGGKFQFTEVWDNGWWQLLATPARTQCSILESFVAYGETQAGSKLVGDVPFKLAREITQSRGARDHWQNTQENLYCLNALTEFSRVYEKDAPKITVRASLGGEPMGNAKFSAFRDPAATLVRPNRAEDAGRKAEVRIEREGTGRIYYATRLSYAPRDEVATATNAGIEITREYSVQRNGKWELLQAPVRVARGELVRVDLYLSLPAARNFVVVDDPVPGGLEPVNRDLATASTVDADQGEFTAAGGAFWFKYGDWSEYGVSLWNFYHRELRHDSARFYADYLPAGHYHLSYAAQAVADGEFAASPVKAEEMYDPDVYGKGLPARLIVGHD
jgi:uncharacterized protein YfaS (alpha-2-macroglobulin family)